MQISDITENVQEEGDDRERIVSVNCSSRNNRGVHRTQISSATIAGARDPNPKLSQPVDVV
jgi:hypothetical protein